MRTTAVAIRAAGCVLGAGALAVQVWAWAPPPQTSPTSRQTQQTPVFRTRTTVAPVTVTVVDKRGRPVTDLTAADFTVFENGVRREIVTFHAQPFDPSPDSPAAPAALRRASRVEPLAPQTRRTFLFVLGYGRIQYPTRAIDGAIEFVGAKLLPQDLVGVIAFNRATELTTDHAQIIRFLERYRAHHERIVFEIREHYARVPPFIPPPPLPERIQRQIDAVFSGDSVPADPQRSAVDLLLGMTRILPLNESPARTAQTYDDVRQAVYRNDNIPLSDAVVRGSFLKVLAGIEYLRFLDGEKHLLALVETIVGVEPGVRPKEWDTTDDERLARRASDARVALNIIHTSGARSSPETVQISQRVAALTGGYFTGVRMAGDALAAVDEATRHSYLLGYAPADASLDGTFRRVRVEVRRPDVTVRHQHGYYSAEEPAPGELQNLLSRSRLTAAATSALVSTSLRVTVEAVMLPAIGIRARARVEFTIDASQIAFERSGDGWVADIDVQIYAGDAQERVVGEWSERIELVADDATRSAWLAQGFRRSVLLPVTEPPRHVKVVVYDFGSDRLGSAMSVVK